MPDSEIPCAWAVNNTVKINLINIITLQKEWLIHNIAYPSQEEKSAEIGLCIKLYG